MGNNQSNRNTHSQSMNQSAERVSGARGMENLLTDGDAYQTPQQAKEIVRRPKLDFDADPKRSRRSAFLCGARQNDIKNKNKMKKRNQQHRLEGTNLIMNNEKVELRDTDTSRDTMKDLAGSPNQNQIGSQQQMSNLNFTNQNQQHISNQISNNTIIVQPSSQFNHDESSGVRTNEQNIQKRYTGQGMNESDSTLDKTKSPTLQRKGIFEGDFTKNNNDQPGTNNQTARNKEESDQDDDEKHEQSIAGFMQQDELHASEKNNVNTQKDLLSKVELEQTISHAGESGMEQQMFARTPQIESRRFLQPTNEIGRGRANQSFSNDQPEHKSFSSDRLGLQRQDSQSRFQYKHWRQNLIQKLTQEQVYIKPEERPKTHQTVIIFDWDDTLLPTSFLIPYQALIYQPNTKPLPTAISRKMQEIDEYAAKLLELSKKSGTTLIITNAAEGWVELSAQRFMPLTCKVLRNDIEIISARTRFERELPRQYQEWKIRAFLDTTQKLEMNAVTNIVALGDNIFEIEAAHKLYQQFQNAFVKTIKLRTQPSTGELTKQLKLVLEQFNHICHSPKNLTVRLQRIENENENNNRQQMNIPQQRRDRSEGNAPLNNPQNLSRMNQNQQSQMSNNTSQGSYTGTGDHTSQILNRLKTDSRYQQQQKTKAAKMLSNKKLSPTRQTSQTPKKGNK